MDQKVAVAELRMSLVSVNTRLRSRAVYRAELEIELEVIADKLELLSSETQSAEISAEISSLKEFGHEIFCKMSEMKSNGVHFSKCFLSQSEIKVAGYQRLNLFLGPTAFPNI